MGIALGRDTLVDSNWREPLMRAACTSFVFLCGALWLSWEYQLGPVPAYLTHYMNVSNEASYVLAGATSMTCWLGAAMLAPHSAIGRLATRSRALHAAVAAFGAAFHVYKADPMSLFQVFGVVTALTLGNSLLLVSGRSETVGLRALNI